MPTNAPPESGTPRRQSGAERVPPAPKESLADRHRRLLGEIDELLDTLEAVLAENHGRGLEAAAGGARR